MKQTRAHEEMRGALRDLLSKDDPASSTAAEPGEPEDRAKEMAELDAILADMEKQETRRV